MKSWIGKNAFFVSLIFAPFTCMDQVEEGRPVPTTQAPPVLKAQAIRGVVVDKESREPIPGAVVSTVPTSLDVITDDEGRFVLAEGVEVDGRYSLIATAPGYAEQELTIDASPGEAVLVHMNLESMRALKGEAVTSLTSTRQP